MRRVLPILLIFLFVAIPLVGEGVERVSPDKFKAMLKGKTKVEVKELLGPPTTANHLDKDETGRWEYGGIHMALTKDRPAMKGKAVYDEITEKTAYSITITFFGGVVKDVTILFFQ